MWIVGVRDWRCLVLALTSPVVLQGLYWGNLTLALLLPLALAWRYRERTTIVGVAVGSAVAAKLIAWPLVVWLLVTKRYRAASWAAASAVVLVVGSWAVVGFDGMLDYPALLRETQDVYATRSDSIAGVLGGLGASVTLAVACCWLAGLALVALAVWVAPREDGDRKAFALLVAAAIVASPIAWPNYAALLFVPIAVTWPRLAPAWFFGYAVWLAGLLPKPEAGDAPPRPPDVPAMVWDLSHATPAAGKALGIVVVVLAVTAVLVVGRRSPSRSTSLSTDVIDGRTGPRGRRLAATQVTDPTLAGVTSPLALVAVAAVLAAVVQVVMALDLPGPWIVPDELIYSELAKSLGSGALPAVRER